MGNMHRNGVLIMSNIIFELESLLEDYTQKRDYEQAKLYNLYTGDEEGRQYAACLQSRVEIFDICIRLLVNKKLHIEELIEKQ